MTVKQADLKRGLNAWKAIFDKAPTVHVQPDGSFVMAPSEDVSEPVGSGLTPLEKWKAGNAAS